MGVVCFTLDQLNRPKINIAVIISAIAVCFFYSMFSKPRDLVFGKLRYGVVEGKRERDVKEADGVVIYYNQFENVPYVFLEVRTDDGEAKKLKLAAHCSRGYEAGDRIAFYNGLHFPLVVDISQKEKIVCSRCGAINEKENKACVDCRSSFFKF